MRHSLARAHQPPLEPSSVAAGARPGWGAGDGGLAQAACAPGERGLAGCECALAVDEDDSHGHEDDSHRREDTSAVDEDASHPHEDT